jgi:regulator of RNase E activity RraB
MKGEGNNDKIYRSIDHSFWSEQKENLIELESLLKKMEFENPKVQKGKSKEGKTYFYLETKSKGNTEYHQIAKTSVLMECLAAIFRVEYDGWGASVENT